MTNQEILDNAPEGATHVDNNGYYLKAGRSGFMEPSDCGLDWDYDYANHTEVRSLADIERIAELEDLAQMIIDAESADLRVLPLMYQAWLHKAKALKEQE